MYTIERQSVVSTNILKHKPAFKNLYRALFFGTGATNPTLVQVPVRLGLVDTVHPDGLDITWWIPPGLQPNAAVVDLDETRITVTRWPLNATYSLPHAYTICIARQPHAMDKKTTDSPEINDQLQALVPGLIAPIRGNVLVIKHTSEGIEHMDASDEDLARSLVQGVLEEGLVGRTTL
ncbi:hypothetical protein B0H11DRAFT_2227554 [Mycena galericulata]|nr:hypothetical protein B0H11DRAFT_2227554 [Mycena galericulata]